MRTHELDYHLPDELIAQSPAEPRDSSRLLLCPRVSGDFSIHTFRHLPEFLSPGDILVTNAARVMPARLFGYKYPSGARIEVFLLERLHHNQSSTARFRALMKRQRRLQSGDVILFPESSLVATIIQCDEEIGENVIELCGVDDIETEIEKIGNIPLPPYIKKFHGDTGRYQTIFARISGSVAAPTAGLHFTTELINALNQKGIIQVECHLRVGWGTFSPIRSENLDEHNLHAEYGEITSENADIINKAKSNGGRIIAVGTTMTRLLESASDDSGIIHPFSQPTNLYITPGYRFRAVDCLITNFHLPKTSLLALVAAFIADPNSPSDGVTRTLNAYKFAVDNRFRFYSFGDAMLII